MKRRPKEKQNFLPAFFAVPYKRNKTMGKNTILIITYKDKPYLGCINPQGTINNLDLFPQQEPFFPFAFLSSKNLENRSLWPLPKIFNEKTKSYLSKTPVLIPVHIQCICITTQSVFPLKRKNKCCSNFNQERGQLENIHVMFPNKWCGQMYYSYVRKSYTLPKSLPSMNPR